MNAPPSSVIFPPDVAVVLVISVISVVDKTGTSPFSLLPPLSSISPFSQLFKDNRIDPMRINT